MFISVYILCTRYRDIPDISLLVQKVNEYDREKCHNSLIIKPYSYGGAGVASSIFGHFPQILTDLLPQSLCKHVHCS